VNISSDSFQLLADGMRELCRNDSGADRLITPRREAMLSLLIKYITEIELHNPALSLVGTSDRRELIIRHILDSLAPLGIIMHIAVKHNAAVRQLQLTRQLQIADVGSGAGLPGIPLAIALPDAAFTLIERKGRRAEFLRNTQTALGLSHVTVEEAEMEKAPPGRFDVVTFRAFKPLEPKIVKKLLRLCRAGGVLAAYKGRHKKNRR